MSVSTPVKSSRITAKKLFLDNNHTEGEWKELDTNEKYPWEQLVKELSNSTKLQSQVNKLTLRLEKTNHIGPELEWSRSELKILEQFKMNMASYRITAFIRSMDKIQRDVIISSKQVYNELGWGYNEKVFQEALKRELDEKGYRIITEVPRTLYYKNYPLGDGVYVRTDMVVETRNKGKNKKLILELKADQGSMFGLKKAKQQLIRYLSKNVNAGNRGMVILFPDKPGELVKFLSCI